MKIKNAAVAWVLALGFGFAPLAFGQAYTFTDLGTFGGTSDAYAQSINNSGQIVVNTSGNPTGQNAFLYSNGATTSLGMAMAWGMNNNGQVAGFGGWPTHAMVYDNGAMSDLGTLGGPFSMALGINNNGHSVGWADTPGGGVASYAFMSNGGAMTNLGTLGTWSQAWGVNDRDQVVGVAGINGGAYHAFLYNNGAMSDLGTLGGPNSQAYDINNNGQVVGFASINSVAYHAILYSNGAMSDLGTLGGSYSYSLSINNNGQAVGVSSIVGNATYHAFLYSDGSLVDLNNLLPQGSGWELTAASDINDLGQVVGRATINGQSHAFLMTPTAPVPEPETYAMMLVGLGLIGFIARRRKQKLNA